MKVNMKTEGVNFSDYFKRMQEMKELVASLTGIATEFKVIAFFFKHEGKKSLEESINEAIKEITSIAFHLYPVTAIGLKQATQFQENLASIVKTLNLCMEVLTEKEYEWVVSYINDRKMDIFENKHAISKFVIT